MSRPDAATAGGLQLLLLPKNNPPTAGPGQGARCVSGDARVATACALPCWPAAASC